MPHVNLTNLTKQTSRMAGNYVRTAPSEEQSRYISCSPVVQEETFLMRPDKLLKRFYVNLLDTCTTKFGGGVRVLEVTI